MSLLRPLAIALALAPISCNGSEPKLPSAPDLTVRATVRGPNEVLIEWDPATAPAYVVRRNGAPISPPLQCASWLDLDVQGGATYDYAIEALDSDRAVHARGATVVATPVPSARWFVEDAYPTGGIGEISACTDATGTLHVLCHDTNVGALLYGRDEGAGLAFEEITRGDLSPRVADLAVDARGTPHAVFARSADLVHAERSAAGAWELTIVATSIAPLAVAITIDGGGDVHVVHRSGADRIGLGCSSRVLRVWSHAIVPTLGPAFGDVDLATLAGGDLAALYFASSELDRETACLAVRTDGLWTTRRVMAVDRTSGAIECGEQRTIHIALFADHRVVLAEGGSSIWRLEAAVEAGLAPQAVDIALSPAGDVHVALYGRAQDVVHAERNDGAWTEEFVDADGNVGAHPAIAVAPDGTIDIVFNDVTGGVLRRARAR